MNNLADSEPQSSALPSGEAPAAGAKRRWVRIAVRWLATIGLVSWLGFSTDWQSVWGAITTASILWLIVAGGIFLASQVASVARWGLLVRAAGIPIGRARLFAAYFEGMFVNICLPTTVGGDVMKVLRIGGSHHKRIAAATVLADRGSGLAALLALLTVGLLLKVDESRRTLALTIATVALVVAALLTFLVLRILPTVINGTSTGNESLLVRMLRNIWKLVPAIVRPLVTRSPWVRVLMWAVVVQSLNVVAVAAAGRAIGLSVPMASLVVATTTVSLAAALPISIAGIGVREASLPILLAADGVPRELSVTLGIAWSVITLAVGLVGGPAHFAAQRRAARDAASAAGGLKDQAA